MKRRTAIGRIVLIGGSTVAAWSGYKWYDWNKTPDISFVQQNEELITALAETIIPATPDSPGAREAGVGPFIIKMLEDCTDIKSKNKFIDGLKELKAHSLSKYNKSYEHCSEEERYTMLKQVEKQDKPWPGLIGKVQNRFLGRSFFTTLKHYTVEGYGTSRLGATKAFVYVPVPGSYHGCIPLQPGQKSWASK